MRPCTQPPNGGAWPIGEPPAPQPVRPPLPPRSHAYVGAEPSAPRRRQLQQLSARAAPAPPPASVDAYSHTSPMLGCPPGRAAPVYRGGRGGWRGSDQRTSLPPEQSQSLVFCLTLAAPSRFPHNAPLLG